MSGFTVAVDQPDYSIDIRVRWKEGANPNEVAADMAKANLRAYEELTERLGEVTVE
jgi:hypothetical protein